MEARAGNVTRRGAEVIVVGAGLSGLAVVAELLACGARDVLVIESGAGVGSPAPDPAAPVRAEPVWASNTPPHYAVPVGANEATAPGWARAPAVGGRSLHWHGVIVRLESYALDDPCWPAGTRELLRGGPSAPGLYEDTEREIAAWRGGSPTARDHAARQEATDERFAAMLADATGMAATIVPQATRAKCAGRPSRAYTPLDRLGTLSIDGADESSDGERYQAGARVSPDTAALRVLERGGRAHGVQVRDRRTGDVRDLHAPVVVLAAGTIENTRLVAQLGRDGVPARFDGLNDHLTQGFVVRVPVTALPGSLRAGAVALLTRDHAHRCNVFARLHAGAPHADAVLLDVWALGEQIRSAESRQLVAPGASGLAAPWHTTVAAGLSGPDHLVLAGERELLASVCDSLARALCLPGEPLRFGDFFAAPRPFHAARAAALAGPTGRTVSYAWPLGCGDHEGGTLPLGTRLDDAGGVRGTDGLYVVGPAAFPRAGAANPSLTTLALATLAARTIHARQG